MSRAANWLVDVDYSDGCFSKDGSSWRARFAGTMRRPGRFSVIINLWCERSKQRRQLLELADSPDLLKDLGLSNYDLQHEGRKPFWRR